MLPTPLPLQSLQSLLLHKIKEGTKHVPPPGEGYHPGGRKLRAIPWLSNFANLADITWAREKGLVGVEIGEEIPITGFDGKSAAGGSLTK